MSWAGFKKNVNRAATQVMVKTGHVEQTHDRSYEVEERRYRVMENAATRLQKESKGYLDSLRAMTASQMRIAETIDAFYGDAGANDGVSRSYKQAVEDLDAETIKALDGPFRSTVLDPINRFCAYFPDINECKSLVTAQPHLLFLDLSLSLSCPPLSPLLLLLLPPSKTSKLTTFSFNPRIKRTRRLEPMESQKEMMKRSQY